MRINNKRINPIIEALYSLLLVGFVISLTLHIIPVPLIVKVIPPYLMNVFFLVLLIIFYKMGSQHFEYDSNGEALNIKTKDAFLGKYFRRFIKNVDFPKKKIVSFKIERFLLFRKLEIVLTSKRSSNGYARLRFNISYLNRREINDLKISLTKIIKNNKNIIEEVNNE